MAFPVTAAGECMGAIEVFSREIRERDPGVYSLTEALGLQVGDFIEGLELQREREEARAQVEAILSGIADAVTAQAPDGHLLFANDAAVTLLGYDSAEALMTLRSTRSCSVRHPRRAAASPSRRRRYPAGERSPARTTPTRSSASGSTTRAMSAGPPSRPARSATTRAT